MARSQRSSECEKLRAIKRRLNIYQLNVPEMRPALPTAIAFAKTSSDREPTVETVEQASLRPTVEPDGQPSIDAVGYFRYPKPGRGAAWISALAWGARGREFKSLRSDFVSSGWNRTCGYPSTFDGAAL